MACQPGRHGRHGRLGERGSLTVETAILFPALLLLILAGVQAAYWYHARQLCLAAAQAGVRAQRPLNAPAGAGSIAARDYLARTDPHSIGVQRIDDATTASSVTVQVHAAVTRVLPLPGFHLAITQSATAARERFSTQGAP